MKRDKTLNEIVKIVVKHLNPKKIILFGSRGKGNFRFNSDYDIAVDSNQYDFRTIRKIKEKVNEAAGLKKVDVVFINEVEDGFKEIINKTGKILYEK
jgi:predicted nucleotidyltransferase